MGRSCWLGLGQLPVFIPYLDNLKLLSFPLFVAALFEWSWFVWVNSFRANPEGEYLQSSFDIIWNKLSILLENNISFLMGAKTKRRSMKKTLNWVDRIFIQGINATCYSHVKDLEKVGVTEKNGRKIVGQLGSTLHLCAWVQALTGNAAWI